MTLSSEDMPFNRHGISPDLIINPHAIPSRMTIGHLMETLVGKAAVTAGLLADATAFNGQACTEKEIGDFLAKNGYDRLGDEIMYNGQTGRKFACKIFFGPVFYQRMKHMTQDKIHARSRGPLQSLIRQPVNGRAKFGGLRFGEMERKYIFGDYVI